MKKAGIVVGLTLILLAGVLFWVTSQIEKKEGRAGEKQSSPAPSFIAESPKETREVNVKLSEDSGQDNRQESGKTFMEFVEEELGKPKASYTEIMVVSKKKVVLFDGSVGTKENKQLVYSVDLLGNNMNSFSLYLNKSAYDMLKVGDKLKVEYVIYENDVGTKFPAVISVEFTD